MTTSPLRGLRGSAVFAATALLAVGCTSVGPGPQATIPVIAQVHDGDNQEWTTVPTTAGARVGPTRRRVGDILVDLDGALVENLSLDGCIQVRANNVIIRNSRISCLAGAAGVTVDSTSTGLQIENCSVISNGSTPIGLQVSNATVIDSEVKGFALGVRLGDHVTLERDWIHDTFSTQKLRTAAIQGISAQQVVIRGNYLDAAGPLSRGDDVAAILLGSEIGSKYSQNVAILGNFLDGGGYALNVSSSISADHLLVQDNVFGDRSRFGAAISRAKFPLGPRNVLQDGRAVVAVVRG